jgi:SAM-dependent methyltransferase
MLIISPHMGGWVMTFAAWANAIEAQGDNPRHWKRYNEYLYRFTDFTGKTVLDVGGGVGRASYYAVAAGAARVVCVEPEANGSHNDMLKRALAIGEKMGVRDRVEFVTTPVEDVDRHGEFDIVLSHNSINHIDEEACAGLHLDRAAREKFRPVIAHIASLCKPGGQLVLTDCSRKNLFAALGIKNPVAPTITWRIHQTPELWAGLFSEAGFCEPLIRWTPDRRSGKFGELFLTSAWASYCLQSHFCLTMRRR